MEPDNNLNITKVRSKKFGKGMLFTPQLESRNKARLSNKNSTVYIN